MSAPTKTAGKHTNRLIHETSPYLLQHAHNPVDWWAWGREAFEEARRQDKPIFLSVGYSTCYWCHVMERESFENEQIAAEMNRRFINIKVDREERPDVDQLYMTAVQVLTHQGGWPMSVFLLPDLRPFYGGTYFPPTDALGRPGFLTLLRAIDGAYRERRQDVLTTAEQLGTILQQLAEPPLPQTPVTINGDVIEEMVRHSIADFDPKLGGFGGAPKFPRQTLLEMLLVYLREMGDQGQNAKRKTQIWSMLRRTLDAMADGGIRDQLGGGFHRYSTDARWLVPHFEIMLYDNAMLGWIYAESYHQAGEKRDAEAARGIFDFVLREMTSPAGAFYTAFDAEVDAREGATYLWTKEEVEGVLKGGFEQEQIDLFCRVYGLDQGPNFADPHHGDGTPDTNILYLPEPLATVAAKSGVSVDELESRLSPMRHKLYLARKRRKQPLLDTKIITGWNGLMIRALAFGGRVLAEPRYLDAAARGAEFLLADHVKPNGDLWRTSRDGIARHDAFVDDYAFLVQALLELCESGRRDHWRQRAGSLANRMVERFGDRNTGGFYFTAADAQDLIVRQKVGTDTPLPSGNAVAAMVMLELDQTDVSRDTIAAFARMMEQSSDGMSAMVEAAILYLNDNDPISVSPGPWRGDVDRGPSLEEIAHGVVSLRAGWAGERELQVYLKISEGYHINAHDAAEGLVATQLGVAEDASGEVEGVEYPEAKVVRVAFAEAPIRVYSGEVTVVVRFKRRMGAAIRMVLTYQACSDRACLPAVSKRFEISATGS